MSSPIIDETISKYKSALDELILEIQEFSQQIDNPELEQTLASLRQNINEPFLFVVVGEVKAGKSSFVNALLQENICQTAAEPCTDKIQQIIYAEAEFQTEITPHLLKIGLPVEILKNLSIVDTPGTNTIVANHQEITKEFIPNSDLVFFVFFAKNPYTRSAWDLLDYVNRQWRKKIIFILQQADLTKPEELSRNKEKLQEYAQQKGIESAIIFATSAELEFTGEITQSGFIEVRNYIHDTLGKTGTQQLKLQGIIETSQEIINRFDSDLNLLQQQLEIDQTTVNTIKERLAKNETRSRYELESLVERLLVKYIKITDKIKAEFRDNLTIFALLKGSFAAWFNPEKSTQAWMENLKHRCEQELKASLGEISQDGVQHFVDGIRQLLSNLVDDLQKIREPQVKTDLLALSIVERRQQVIEDVHEKVADLLEDESFLKAIDSINASIAPRFLGGSAATVAGTLIATITEVVLLDILGVAFAGVGLVIAGGTIFFKRKKIIQKFEQKLDQEKDKFTEAISSKLNSQLSIIYEEIERNFIDIYDYVEKEENKIIPLVGRYEQIQARSTELFNSIQGSVISD